MNVSENLGAGLFKFLDFITVKEKAIDEALSTIIAEVDPLKAKRSLSIRCPRSPKLGNSLFWMVEELRSNLWKGRS